jgi:hypothetical protein
MNMNEIFIACQKVFGEKEEKLDTGNHKVDCSVTIIDHVSGSIQNIDIQGNINKGEDYERTGTVSVSIYEFAAAFAAEFGSYGDEAVEKACKAMGKMLEKKEDGKLVVLSKKMKAKMDTIKEVFAETIPKVSVSGKQTVKVNAKFAEIESSKAM